MGEELKGGLAAINQQTVLCTTRQDYLVSYYEAGRTFSALVHSRGDQGSVKHSSYD